KPVEIEPVGKDPYQRVRLSPDGRQAVVVTGSGVDQAPSDAPTSALLTDIVRPDPRLDPRTVADEPGHLLTSPPFALQPPIVCVALLHQLPSCRGVPAFRRRPRYHPSSVPHASRLLPRWGAAALVGCRSVCSVCAASAPRH